MPRKRIYKEPLTNAEKQSRYREKNNPITEERLDRELIKVRKELHGYIDNLSENELYAVRQPLTLIFLGIKTITDKKIAQISRDMADIDLDGYMNN